MDLLDTAVTEELLDDTLTVEGRVVSSLDTSGLDAPDEGLEGGEELSAEEGGDHLLLSRGIRGTPETESGLGAGHSVGARHVIDVDHKVAALVGGEAGEELVPGGRAISVLDDLTTLDVERDKEN